MNSEDPIPPNICGDVRRTGHTVWVCVGKRDHPGTGHFCVNIDRVDSESGEVSPAREWVSAATSHDLAVQVEHFIETRKDEPDVVMALQELLFAMGY